MARDIAFDNLLAGTGDGTKTVLIDIDRFGIGRGVALP
jgi:hypothetical protein